MTPRAARRRPLTLESAMLKHTRIRLLAAATGAPGWAHPYSDPFTCYADGGDSEGGGDGDGDAGGDDADDDDSDGDDGDADDKDGDQDDEAKLGEKGLKALREVRRENRRLKAQLRERGDGDGSGRKASAKDGKDRDQDDAEAIREQARADARAEVWTERVEAAAIASAAGRLANPSRVAALLGEDLADIPKDDKGRPDKDAISELIDDLLESDPYLAAPATGDKGRRFQGDADGGARKKTKKAAASLDEAIAAKFAGKSGG
ncbi:hypothetical protein AB0912_00275 [Streptomyces sp. NPDC007084]|uniref:hypothetical protein n=1 Tax=Streptomyces sp. NPDC007084 TaxID=3154313 RepID=UPI003456B281